MKSNQKKRIKILFIIVFICGLILSLYPFFSDLWIEHKQSDAVIQYKKSVDQLTMEEIDRELKTAEIYNSKLDNTNYYDTLSFDEVMFVVEIPSINLKLPVYHGTEDKVLSFALGHLQNTSLPIGSKGTHCVITGHTGLTDVQIFDNLDKVQIGDTIKIHLLNRIIEYKADAINIVEPTDTSLLQPIDDKDYITLLTCYPYGVNSHRLLVRAERVKTQILIDNSTATMPNESLENVEYIKNYDENSRSSLNFLAIAIISVFAVGLLVFVKSKRNVKKG